MAFALMLFAALVGFGSAIGSALIFDSSLIGVVGIYLTVILGVFCPGLLAIAAVKTARHALDGRKGAWPLVAWPADGKPATRSA